MALTPEETAVVETRLAEAEAAYHDWRIGRHTRSFQDSNGEKVDYSVEAMRGLPAYIAELKRLLGTAVSAPMRPFYL